MLLQPRALVHELRQQSLGLTRLQGVKIDRGGRLCGEDGCAHCRADMVGSVPADSISANVEPTGQGVVRNSMRQADLDLMS
jgi:hypothetical protein